MSLDSYIQAMPKAELHVHLEGAVQPETLLKLAARHKIALPADSVEGLRAWYRFTDFNHFIEIYIAISNCIRTIEDIETIADEFLANQAAQNIRYSEVTYTAYTHYESKGLPFEDQLAALNRARARAEKNLGITARWVIDISRQIPAEEGLITARWAVAGMDRGVVALGLGGPEVGHPPEKFAESFAIAKAAGLPGVPHAGETEGPSSIRNALHDLDAVRIGHGVRCLEDPALVDELRIRQIPLEVCPTSNVCLHVAASMAEHPLPRLLAKGLYVTLNSDDPTLFNTSLVEEYRAAAHTFGFTASELEQLSLNAVRAALLPTTEKQKLEAEFKADFEKLGRKHL